MTLSVAINPVLESRVEEEARRLGITPSDFVKEVLEQALGMKNPAEIYRRVCSFTPMGDPDASSQVADKVRARLRANHSSRVLAWHSASDIETVFLRPRPVPVAP